MLKIVMRMEDQGLVAERDKTVLGLWDVVITDMPTLKEKSFQWKDAQIAAVIALSIGGDDVESVDKLYAVAEPLFAGVDKDLRFIP